MARPREHGTPEGYEAGCTKNAACPAYRVHGMSCETAYLRFVSGERRYMQLRGRGLTSTAIASRLGFFAPVIETLPPTEPATDAAPPLAESAQDTAPQEDAATPAIEEEAPAAGTPAAEAEAMGHPTHSTQEDTTMAEFSAQHVTLPTPTDALAEELPAPAVPKTPRQKPVTKPKAKPRRARTVKLTVGPSQSEVRVWARHVGLDVNVKGSVRSDVMQAYLDAHPTPTGAGEPAAPPTTADDLAKQPAEGSPASAAVVPPEFDEAMGAARIRAALEELGPEVEEGPWVEVAEQFAEAPAGPRPEWADVTIPEDIERARSLAVRLEQELARVEADNAQLQTALDTVVTRWWAQVEENNQLRTRLDAELAANQVLRATDYAIAGLRRVEFRKARHHARGARR